MATALFVEACFRAIMAHMYEICAYQGMGIPAADGTDPLPSQRQGLHQDRLVLRTQALFPQPQPPAVPAAPDEELPRCGGAGRVCRTAAYLQDSPAHDHHNNLPDTPRFRPNSNDAAYQAQPNATQH